MIKILSKQKRRKACSLCLLSRSPQARAFSIFHTQHLCVPSRLSFPVWEASCNKSQKSARLYRGHRGWRRDPKLYTSAEPQGRAYRKRMCNIFKERMIFRKSDIIYVNQCLRVNLSYKLKGSVCIREEKAKDLEIQKQFGLVNM